MSLRTLVFDTLKVDPQLNTLGIVESSLYPAQAPDSPPQRRFVVLRWGNTAEGVGVARSTTLSVWAYDRDSTYAGIIDILARARTLLGGLVGMPTGDGYVLGVNFDGASPDFWDDVYKACTRNESIRITASGI